MVASLRSDVRPWAALLLAAAGGCSTPDRPETERPPPLPVPEVQVPPALAGSVGFDPVEPARDWGRDDRALWSVFVKDGRREASWLLHVVSAEDESEEMGVRQRLKLTTEDWEISESSPPHDVRVEVWDGDDPSSVASSTAEVPRLFLERGFASYCASFLAAEPDAETDAETVDLLLREMGFCIASLVGLVRLAEDVEALQDVMWSVLEKPSLASFVFHLGIDVNIRLTEDVERVAEEDLPEALVGREAFRLPIELSLNERPALFCVLTVVRPEPPFALVGGIVRIDGWHPRKRDKRVAMELLGARLGSTAGR